MADQWYYQASGKITGPISASELGRLTKSGVLTPDTLVRKSGRENWVPARQVKGLFEEGRQQPAESLPQSDTGNVRAAQAQGTVSERQKIGRFEIRSRLGAGAFGAVYRAYDPVLDREVALKVPHRDTLRSEKDKERFLREAKAA